MNISNTGSEAWTLSDPHLFSLTMECLNEGRLLGHVPKLPEDCDLEVLFELLLDLEAQVGTSSWSEPG